MIIAGKLRLRVTCWKSANFTFTVTARPKALAFSHQAQTSSAMASTPASIWAAAVRSRSKVASEPKDLRGRSATTGRSSLAAGNAEIPIGGFAEMLLQKAERFCFQIRARFDPEPLHPCCRDGSDAMKPGDRQRCDEILALSGVVTNWPFGLRWPDASLARNLCRKCPPRLSDLFREECAHEFPWQ